MDPNNIKPFITSIQNVFSTMLQLPVTVKEPRLKENPTTSFEVSGIIGLSGDLVGNVVLSMQTSTAERVASIFSGTPQKFNTPDFSDAIGELINMIAGGAKALFKTKRAMISCPTVVLGLHTVTRPSGVPTIVIPCHTDCGEVVIEVSIKESSTPAPAGSTAATAHV